MRYHAPGMPRTASFLVLVAALSSPATAGAGMLDFIRNYDLNDYALGIAITVSQSPYTAGSSSVLPYPFLTSFNNPAFTRDWLLLFDDAGTGFRFVSKAGWEIGAVGRLDPGGFGQDVGNEFFELREREWTVNAGGYVGWRGWPVHFQLRAFTEILGRHDGSTGEFAVSLPLSRDWGFLIPSAELVYQNAAHNDYYFGVTPPESSGTRPIYAAGADTNVRVRLRAGYRISDKWLLTGFVAMESLGDEIRNSPIVDRNRVYSYNVGLAYNADIFNPRDFAYADADENRVEVRVGAFYNNIDTELQLFGNDGIPGDILDFESDAGGSTAQWVPEIDVFVRLGDYHRLEFGYFEVGREATAVSLIPRRIGNVTLPANESFTVASSLRSLRAMYSYSFMRDPQKELGLSGGLQSANFRIDIETPDGQTDRLDGEAVLPAIGAHGSLSFGQKSRLAARLQLFRSAFDGYDGFVAYGTIDWSREVSEGIRLGLAYNAYIVSLESTRDAFEGTYRTVHHGPSLFLSAGF